MSVTSEYIHLNPKLNEITDIIYSTRLEHDKKIWRYLLYKN